MLNTNKQIEIKKLGFKEYSKALEIQNHYHDEICNIKLSNRKNNKSTQTPNYLLFVEHNHCGNESSFAQNASVHVDLLIKL